MPSISALLKRRKAAKSDAIPSGLGSGSTGAQDSDANEKIQRRQSKRDIIRGLFSRTSNRSDSRSTHRASQIETTVVQTPGRTSPAKPTSPMSDPNKPLPPPPAPGTQDEEPVRSIPMKLNRIMSPLATGDIHKLFSGAPQFFCRSDGVFTGAPWPSIAFPFNSEIEIRDLADHGQIEDQAWGCVTAAQHITRDMRKNAEAKKEHLRKRKGHFRPKCFERPNMVSYQGLERGTMGFSAALQMGVADALLEEEEPNGLEPLVGRRHNFLNDKNNGLRMLDELDIATRLSELGILYNEDTSIHTKTNVELYTELFTKVLFPPTRVTDSDDPYSLHVQIEALLKVLAVEHIWIDFSIVEWRIRLGQILWGPPYEPDGDDDISINGEVAHQPGQQKYWLLFQLVLSCELLVRLDVITKNAERNPSIISEDELKKFNNQFTVSVRWSMILARQWLENIKVEFTSLPASPDQAPAASWLESLTGIGTGKDTTPAERTQKINFTGLHQARQFQGLIHFAKKLDWPRIDIIASTVTQGLLGEEATTVTPAVGTPLSMTTQRSSSYFGNNSKRPGLRRGLSKQSRMSATVHPAGWLSQSYLTGLVLPGEGLSHVLVSTLLENDAAAVATLGEEANLYGGFVYSGKSFWSTSCVIGRVLAAGKGASECMGWLSTEVIPKGVKDGWVNIDVDVAPQDVDNTPATSRIWKKHHIERDSHILGTAHADPSSLLPGDFALPLADAPSEAPLLVSLISLDLFTTVSSSSSSTPAFEEPSTPHTNDVSIRTYSANVRFTVSGLGESVTGKTEREIDLELKYDVHFVTAHPCVPSQHTKILSKHTSLDGERSSTSDTSAPSSPVGGEGAHELFCGHPLHKSHIYTRHHLSSILAQDPNRPSPLASLHTSSPSIFIIDCTTPLPRATAPFSTAPTSPTKVSYSPTGSAVAAGLMPRSPALPPHMSIYTISSSATSSVASLASTLSTPAPTGLAAQLQPHPFRGRKRKFGGDLEMLARAWCAEKGYNALISRRGRNCIACSVREARALGWKIVLRFG